jgi:hypothetical protein
MNKAKAPRVERRSQSKNCSGRFVCPTFCVKPRRFVSEKTTPEKPRILGSKNSDLWRGQVIQLSCDPKVDFDGELVGGIRVRSPKPETF